MKIRINKKKGIFFRISGLPGSGKTRISQKLLPKIKKEFGPTIMWSGDDIRRIFKNRKYSLKDRIEFGVMNIKLAKFFLGQKINVIFATVGLDEGIRKYTKKNIENYIEILISVDLKKLKNSNIRKFYKSGSKNVWGNDIKPSFPKKPTVKIKNNFKDSLDRISSRVLTQILKIT